MPARPRKLEITFYSKFYRNTRDVARFFCSLQPSEGAVNAIKSEISAHTVSHVKNILRENLSASFPTLFAQVGPVQKAMFVLAAWEPSAEKSRAYQQGRHQCYCCSTYAGWQDEIHVKHRTCRCILDKFRFSTRMGTGAHIARVRPCPVCVHVRAESGL